jgi:hypothetical protein
VLVHLADLANPARPFPLAAAWAERVVAEFLQQGEREAEHGLPVSAMCDPARVTLPRAQLDFIRLFAQVGPRGAPWMRAASSER